MCEYLTDPLLKLSVSLDVAAGWIIVIDHLLHKSEKYKINFRIEIITFLDLNQKFKINSSNFYCKINLLMMSHSLSPSSL